MGMMINRRRVMGSNQPNYRFITAFYDVVDTEQPIRICYTENKVQRMFVDGVEMPYSKFYQFSTTGIHMVEFDAIDKETVASYFFYHANTIVEVYIPKGYKLINNDAFLDCGELTKCYLPNGLERIDNNVFANKKHLEYIDIPNSVVSFGTSCFESSGLKQINFPPNITNIPEGCFRGCKLENIILPEGVTEIGYSSFFNNTTVSYIVIPSTVVSIGSYAFWGCTPENGIKVLSTTPPTLSDNTAFSSSSCIIYVPSDCVETYKQADVWSSYASRIRALEN